MSPPPCTLFCPRRGLRPEPHRPTCPVSEREVDERQHVVDGVVVLGDAERPAHDRAVGARVHPARRGDELRVDARHGGHRLRAVRLEVCAQGLETLRSAGEEGRVMHRLGDDHVADGCWRARCHGRRARAATRRPRPRRRCGGGRPRTSFAPRCMALSTWWKKMGCVSRALDPHRTTRSVSSTSRYELVPPPAPNTVARPTTLGACQVRLQESMWLDPIAMRIIFCAR
jgi:hypothetical protein